MAEILTDYNFNLAKASSHHPWVEWLDGKIRRLEQGTDFDCAPISIINGARVHAKKLGGTVRNHKDGTAVILQYVPPAGTRPTIGPNPTRYNNRD